MTKLCISVAVAILLLLSASVNVHADSSGKIEGQLTNLTTGSTNTVAGQIIIMQTYQGTSKIDEKTTLTDQDGRFGFNNLDNQTALVYVVQTVFQNVHYFANQISFAAGENLKTVSINVYDATTAADNVQVEMSHVILSPLGSVLNVIENYVFVNHSDLTYIGSPTLGTSGGKETVTFNVPNDATDVAVSIPLPGTPQIQNGAFSDSTPISPDGVFYSYNYKLEINQDSRTLSWKINYDTARFDLLVDNSSVKVNSSLTKGDALVISGKTYQDYWVEGLKKGETITAELSGLAPGGAGFNYLWLLLILAPIGIAAILLLVKKRKTQVVAVTPDGPVSEETEQTTEKTERTPGDKGARTKLMQEIAALDDSFENGDIDEDEYHKLRKEKKDELLSMSRNKEG